MPSIDKYIASGGAPLTPSRAADAFSVSGRRQEIASAGLACFERLGMSGTRVEDVLAQADISRSTFYRHFPNIDELIKFLIARSTRTLVEEAVAASNAENLHVVDAVSEVVARMVWREDTPIVKMLGAEELQRFSYLIIADPDAMAQLFEPLAALLLRGQREGSLRADLTIDEMVEWISRCIASIRFRRPIDAGSAGDLKAYARRFVMPAIIAPTASDPVELARRLSRIELMLESIVSERAGGI